MKLSSTLRRLAMSNRIIRRKICFPSSLANDNVCHPNFQFSILRFIAVWFSQVLRRNYRSKYSFLCNPFLYIHQKWKGVRRWNQYCTFWFHMQFTTILHMPMCFGKYLIMNSPLHWTLAFPWYVHLNQILTKLLYIMLIYRYWVQ